MLHTICALVTGFQTCALPISSMWIGNCMLVIINLPLIGIWVRFLQVPYRLLFPTIVLICCLGIYSIGSQPSHVMQIGIFGLLGYLFHKLRLEPAPLLLGLVLGGLLEGIGRASCRERVCQYV